MIIRTRIGGYNPHTQEWNDNLTVLVTNGCGCCETDISPTVENIQAAIKEHEEFIAELKLLLEKVSR